MHTSVRSKRCKNVVSSEEDKKCAVLYMIRALSSSDEVAAAIRTFDNKQKNHYIHSGKHLELKMMMGILR